MTDEAGLKRRLMMAAILGVFITLGLILCAFAYARRHSLLPIASAVAMLCGGGVFLNSTYHLAKRRMWTKAAPSHD